MNDDLKFIYFTPADIQTPRVDRQCVVHFCESVHRLGVDLEMVTLGIELLSHEKPAAHPLEPYRIKERFPVVTVPTRINQRTQDHHAVRAALTRLWANATRALGYIRRQPREKRLVFFVKNYAPALAFLAMRALTRKKLLLLFEAHTTPRRFYQRYLLRHADGIVANSLALGRDLVARHGVPADRVVGTHQGIDLELVERERVPRDEARRMLGIGAEEKVAVYAGKINWGYREVEYILEASRSLPEGVRVLMVGGRADHVEKFRAFAERERLTNVTFVGFVAPVEVQAYLAAADALLLYYPTGIDLNKYRSPGKLFEYMASGRPVIAVDFPVLYEILGDDPAAEMVPPDAPDLLAAAIVRVLEGGPEIEARAARGLERVALFSWEARARTVLEFVDRRARARGI